ncbi:MAG: CAP domain-containing protein [Roseburia sp.]|nr:CAP domain-containing protein [Roseburia sp.]
MKRRIKNLFFLLMAGTLLAFMGTVSCDAKTIRIAPEIQKGKTKTIYTIKKKQKGKGTLKKVTAKTSNKSVANVRVAKANGGKKYCVKVTGKKIGSVMINVKVKRKLTSGKMKVSTLWFNTDIGGSEKQKAQEAFELQNEERKKVGKKELEWSEELWRFASLRGSKDGFDYHHNMDERADEYFCLYGISIGNPPEGENLYKGSTYPISAIEAWKNSSGHYGNMIDSHWQCGAIAYCEKTNTWVAIFSSKSLSVIENWKTENVILRITRTDNTTGEGISGSAIMVVDENGNEVCRSSSPSKNSTYSLFEFEEYVIGKTYKVIEISVPEGYRKAANVTFTARGASEGIIEIVLSSEKR